MLCDPGGRPSFLAGAVEVVASCSILCLLDGHIGVNPTLYGYGAFALSHRSVRLQAHAAGSRTGSVRSSCCAVSGGVRCSSLDQACASVEGSPGRVESHVSAFRCTWLGGSEPHTLHPPVPRAPYPSTKPPWLRGGLVQRLQGRELNPVTPGRRHSQAGKPFPPLRSCCMRGSALRVGSKKRRVPGVATVRPAFNVGLPDSKPATAPSVALPGLSKWGGY